MKRLDRLAKSCIVSSVVAAAIFVLLIIGCIPSVNLFGFADSNGNAGLVALKFIFGILGAIAFVASFSAAFIFAYFLARQRWAKRKLIVEAVSLGSVVLFSFAVKFAIIYFYSQDLFETESFSAAMATTLKAFYDVIGGLQFEGLSESTGSSPFLLVLFHGTSLVTGIFFLVVIGSTFAYEFYSYLQLRVHFFGRKSLRSNLYVFTELNEETLCLAKSIKENHEKEAREGKDLEEDIIVFAGPALEPFDRHDELCVEAMGNHFLYWSYSEEEHQSIAAALGLAKKTNVNENGNPVSKFFVFAFETDGKSIPEEEKNSDAIFDDMEARMNPVTKKGKTAKFDKFYIQYVMLGKGEFDFQAYQNKWNTTVNPSLSASEAKNLRISMGILIPWAESVSIASQVAVDMKKSKEKDPPIPNTDKTTVLAVGFGQTSQAIVNEIYSQSAMTNCTLPGVGIPSEAEFEALIFDENSNNIAGFFQSEHPLINVLKGNEIRQVALSEHEVKRPNYRFFDMNFTNIDVMPLTNNGLLTGVDYVVIAVGDDRKTIRIANALISARVSDYLQKKKRVEDAEKRGEDVSKLKEELASKRIVFFVNVYDKRNNHFLMHPDNSSKSSAEDTAFTFDDGTSVFIVGNREETFDSNAIAPQTHGTLYNGCYNVFNSLLQKEENFLSVLVGEDVESLPKLDYWCTSMGVLKSLYTDHPEEAVQDLKLGERLLTVFEVSKKIQGEGGLKWGAEELWNRQSTIEATLFSPLYISVFKARQQDPEKMLDVYAEKAKKLIDALKTRHGEVSVEIKSTIENLDSLSEPELILYMFCNDPQNLKIIADLVQIEHIRWTRFHIAHGWRASNVKNKPLRLHDCILDMTGLENSKITYDFVNVVLSLIASLNERYSEVSD